MFMFGLGGETISPPVDAPWWERTPAPKCDQSAGRRASQDHRRPFHTFFVGQGGGTLGPDCCFAHVVSDRPRIGQRGNTDISGSPRRLCFDFAHGFFQRQSLAHDFGFGKRRATGAQLS
jgi:hypothetical protein